MPTLDSTNFVYSSARIYEQFEILQIMSYLKTLGRVHHPLLLLGKQNFVAGLVVTDRRLPAHPSAQLHALTRSPARSVVPASICRIGEAVRCFLRYLDMNVRWCSVNLYFRRYGKSESIFVAE
jgi:hypothetical protein